MGSRTAIFQKRNPGRREGERLLCAQGLLMHSLARSLAHSVSGRPSSPALKWECSPKRLSRHKMLRGRKGRWPRPDQRRASLWSCRSAQEKDADADSPRPKIPARLQSIPGWAKGDPEARSRARGGERLMSDPGLEPRAPRLRRPPPCPSFPVPRSSRESGACGLPAAPAGPLLPSGGQSAQRRPRRQRCLRETGARLQTGRGLRRGAGSPYGGEKVGTQGPAQGA